MTRRMLWVQVGGFRWRCHQKLLQGDLYFCSLFALLERLIFTPKCGERGRLLGFGSQLVVNLQGQRGESQAAGLIQE
eukprot:s37_g33.t1